MGDDGLLAEQQAYYRARAPEYDEWWQRRGRYDRGPEMAGEWHRQVARAAAALDAFGATGDVLELAGGTGWWTARPARTARHLTVVDSSDEALAPTASASGGPTWTTSTTCSRGVCARRSVASIWCGPPTSIPSSQGQSGTEPLATVARP